MSISLPHQRQRKMGLPNSWATTFFIFAAAALATKVFVTILAEYRFYFPANFQSTFLLGREASFLWRLRVRILHALDRGPDHAFASRVFANDGAEFFEEALAPDRGASAWYDSMQSSNAGEDRASPYGLWEALGTAAGHDQDPIGDFE